MKRTVASRLRDAGEAAFAAFVRNRSDRQLERTVGSRAGLRMIFKGMERAFVPAAARGFEGEIQYVLTSGSGDHRWVVAIDRNRARTCQGSSSDPVVTLSTSIPTFARMIAGQANPAREMMVGNFEISGDFEIALRLADMFGVDPAGAG